MKILVINPGSTSTKLSLFEDEMLLFEESEFHDAPVLLRYPSVNDQVPFRKQVILDIMHRHGFTPRDVDVFVGRGGSAYPQRAGVMPIDEWLYKDTWDAVGGSEHAAKLGVLLAYELCREYGGQMFTLNPTNIDELCDYARMTGISGVYRNAQTHALNQKAVARYHAESMGRRYEDCRFVVAHIDGGVTINAHDCGKMVDGNVGSGGDGPFAPTRIGSVPVLCLLDYLEHHSLEEARLLCSRAGGFVSHFGTSDANKVHRLVEEGDQKAVLVWNAMIYQIAKEIGAMSAVLCGKVDGILLTGGLVRYDDIVEGIRKPLRLDCADNSIPRRDGAGGDGGRRSAGFARGRGSACLHQRTGVEGVWILGYGSQFAIVEGRRLSVRNSRGEDGSKFAIVEGKTALSSQ